MPVEERTLTSGVLSKRHHAAIWLRYRPDYY